MRFSIISSVLVLGSTLLSSTLALQALSSSPCAAKCGNVLDETNGEDDIACTDRDYGTTAKANVFQACISCQLTSKYVDTRSKQTDLQWALYNLRYAVSWCLFGYPNNTQHGTTPCMTSTACGTLENAFEFDSLSPNATAYGYCALMHTEILPKCTACVSHQNDEFYVTNYITALAAACQQQPVLGATISIEGSLFSKTRTNITDPNAAARSFHKAAEGGLPLGAKVGIAIGALAIVLTTLGCCIVWRGKKRRRAVLAKRRAQPAYAEWVAHQAAQRSPHPGMGYPQQNRGFFQDSPQSAMSQQPLFPNQDWGRGSGRIEEDHSPASSHGEKKFFSPYSSNYSSPISATEQVHMASREWPTEMQSSSFGNGTVRPPVREGSGSGERQGDRIEMQNVAPVLLHPGHGR